MKPALLALAACVVVVAARAADSDAAERARIRDERAQAQRLFEEREHVCNERFAVTGCLDAARAQRRETMDRLRQQELVLDNAERKQRAAARAARIREKESIQESKPGPPGTREPPVAPKPAARASVPAASGATANAAPRISDEQARRNQAAFAEKQKQAAEHRADVERRNAERSQKTKASAPLPVPKAASVP
jgi:hypothetical protein